MDFVREGIRLDFMLGPFQDIDGNPITNLSSTTLRNNSILVVNNSNGGATTSNPSVSSTMNHLVFGYYRIHIDSDSWSPIGWTEGERLALIFDYNSIGILPMWKDWKILSNNGYGSIFKQEQLTNYLNTDVKKINGVISDAQTIYQNTLDSKNNIGSPSSLGGTTDISGMLRSIADNNSGNDFDSAQDSLHELTGTIVEAVPVNVVADGQTLNNGTIVAGDYNSTKTNDGTYLQAIPNGTQLDIELLYSVGLDDTPSTLSVNGYQETGAGSIWTDVFAWNYTTNGYDQLSDSITRMNEGTADLDYTYTLLPAHKNSVDGKMRIRFLSSSSSSADNLFLDAVIVKTVNAGSTPAEIAQATFDRLAPYTVYQDGIYIDTINGASGTDIGVNGIQGNPVDNIADAFTIANAVGVRIFTVNTGTILVLDRNVERWTFRGLNADLDFSGFDIDGCQFYSFSLSGVATSVSGRPLFKECAVGEVTLPECVLLQCGLIGPITFSKLNGFYLIDFCSSAIAGSITPCFIFGQDGILMNLRHWSGGIEFENVQSNSKISVEGDGQVVFNVNCSGGEASIRGNFKLSDNSAGNVTIDDNARITIEQVRKSLQLEEQLGTSPATSIDGKLDKVSSETDGIIHITDKVNANNEMLEYILPRVDDTNIKVTTILNSDFLSLSDTVDGITISKIFEYVMGMSTGKFSYNESNGEMIVFKRDNITPLYTLKEDGNDRTRISG